MDYISAFISDYKVVNVRRTSLEQCHKSQQLIIIIYSVQAESTNNIINFTQLILVSLLSIARMMTSFTTALPRDAASCLHLAAQLVETRQTAAAAAAATWRRPSSPTRKPEILQQCNICHNEINKIINKLSTPSMASIYHNHHLNNRNTTQLLSGFWRQISPVPW